MAPVFHPFLDLPRPDLADLLARATPDGQELLVLAARLAARRIGQQEAIAAALDELTTPPWLTDWHTFDPPPRGELQVTDLARAALAARPDLVASLVFAGFEDDLDPSRLEAHARPWADLRHDLPPAPARLTLPRWWARRWALYAGELDAAACVQNLGPDGLGFLAGCSKRYVEGLVTHDEALNFALDRMAGAGRPGNAAPPAPGYVDHFGGLDRLADALVRGPGAVLLGEPGHGRRALLGAFGRRLRGRGEPAALRGLGFNVDNFHGGPMLGTAGDPDAFMPPAAVDPRMIYGLTPTGFAAAIADDPARAMARLIQHCAALACDPAAEFRLVLAADGHELRRLRQLAPELAGLVTVAVPPIPDEELLAAWLMHAPGIEDRTHRRVSLAAIAVALAKRDEAARREFGRDDDIVAAIGTYPVNRLEKVWRTATPDELQTQLRRRLGRGAWVPNSARLQELLALERSVLGP